MLRCHDAPMPLPSMPMSKPLSLPMFSVCTTNSSILARSKLLAEFSSVNILDLPLSPMSLQVTVESVPANLLSDVCTAMLYLQVAPPEVSGLRLTYTSSLHQSSWKKNTGLASGLSMLATFTLERCQSEPAPPPPWPISKPVIVPTSMLLNVKTSSEFRSKLPFSSSFIPVLPLSPTMRQDTVASVPAQRTSDVRTVT